MKIQENVPLAQYTTFRIGGPARFFCIVKSEDELMEAVNFAKKNLVPFLVIGGGSNLLFSDQGYHGLVIKNEILGKTFTDDGTLYSVVDVGAGEDWERFVAETVERDLFGIENLSAIPGTVGAAPVQNIGAYGTEVGKVIESVRVLDTRDLDHPKFVDLSFVDCKFSYRDSIFKHDKGRYIVTRVRFRLCKQGEVNIEYKDVKKYFAEKSVEKSAIKLRDVRDAVIEIRKNKLPDWTQWGTAGSFFKNPIILATEFDTLKTKFPELTGFVESDGRVKISLSYVLDKICNKRGIFKGNVGTYEKQALVVVTKPGATSTEVVDFTRELIDCVYENIGIRIEAEVEWVAV